MVSIYPTYLTFQISEPNQPPMMLQGHSEEVTSVAWCPTDLTKVSRQTFIFDTLNKSEVFVFSCCEAERF